MQSQLNTSTILKRNPAPPRDFYNFMTGGSKALAGATSTGTAANKIVKFSSGAVRPNAPNMSSLISNISTNVNNTETQNITKNVIQNTNKNFSGAVSGLNSQFQKIVARLQSQVQNTLNSLIENFKKDYQQRIQNKDASSPSNILKNFLGLYRNAVDLITYFGDARNHKKISASLKALRKMFSDSFDVAVTIRQTISRITKQLSNLPTASGAAPDLSIDVRVPGSSLKQSGTRTMSQMTGGRGLGLGIGAGMLGMGLLGAGAAAIGMNRARAFQEKGLYGRASGAERSQDVPEGFLDGLQKIISRLVESVDKLVSMGQKPSTRRSAGSSSVTPTVPDTSPGSTSGTGTPEQQALLQTIQYAEGTQKSYGTIFGGKVVKELEEGKLTVQETIDMANSARMPQRLGGASVPYASGSRATGVYQFMPDTLKGLVKSGILKANEPFTKEAQDRAALHLALSRGVTPELLKAEGFSRNVSNKLSPEWPSLPLYSGGSPYRGQSTKSFSDVQAKYNQIIASGPNVTSQSNLNVNIGGTPAPSTAQPAATAAAVPPPPAQAARPAASQAAPVVVNVPPQIISAPAQQAPTVQNRVTPPMTTGSEGNTPDISGLMDTSNPENPYIFLPFSLGIIM